MKRTGIPHDTWKEEALQRVKWRAVLRKATSAVEELRQQEYRRVQIGRGSCKERGYRRVEITVVGRK